MKTIKKAMSLLLAVVMLIAMLPTGVFAAYKDEFSDFPTGWSKVAMEAAVDNGLLNGFVDGTIKPGANLTRAEMAAIITRAFNAKTKADISAFADVNPSAWYYDYIAKAVKMGALNGKSSTMMYPDTPITREEVFTAVARVLVLSSENTSALNRYNDKENISSWALKSMCALAERGYVNGDDLGNAKPKANITREEFAQFMYNTIRTYITKEGTYTKDLTGITVLRVGNVILEDINNTSDLVLGDGVGEDPVRITNVNVEKRLLTRGGRVTLQNTTVTEGVVVNNVNGITYFNNYRTEKVFDGIIENTEARFKERESGGTVVPHVKKYKVTFIGVDGIPTIVRVEEGTAIGSQMPDAPTKLGWTFTGWKDEHGNPVTAETIVNGDMTVTANLTPHTYIITYDFSTTGGSFKADYVGNEPTSYTPENKDTIVLPDRDDIEAPDGKYFVTWTWWIDNGTGLEELAGTFPLFYEDGTEVILVPVYTDEEPTYYTVKFYRGYSLDHQIGEPVGNIPSGESFSSMGKQVPEITVSRSTYKKDASIADIYKDSVYEHTVKPSWWYENEEGKLVPFTAGTKILKDTNVYRLYKNHSLVLTLGANTPLTVKTTYEGSTRLLDSFKEFALRARDRYEFAINNGIIPNVDDKAFDKLSATKIIDDQGNIKILEIPVSIGKVVKRDTVNGSIKKFVRDTINNDAKLDSILDMIDIDQFIADININQMVEDMTDEELRDLIKSDSYKGDVIDFVLEDLEKTDSKMLDAVVDHIMTEQYKNDLVNEIMTKLEKGTAEDSIIEFIKESDKLLDMVITALENGDASLMPSAVTHIKTNLAANTTAGASLRKTVLTSNKLKEILMQATIKSKLLEMMTDKTFVNKAMENHDFRVEIVEAIVYNDHFLEMLVETPMFTNYVVDSLHHGVLKTDILSLLDSESEFKTKIIAEIKENETFHALVKKGDGVQPDGALRAEVLEKIKFSDFVATADEDNFVAYVFGRLSGSDLDTAKNKYSFITEDKIEEIFETRYPGYDMSPNKQAFKDGIYTTNYASAKATVIDEAKSKFNSYKIDIVDKLANNEAITDTKVNEIIDKLLVDHTKAYINRNDEDPLNEEEKAIQSILVHYVGDLLKGEGVAAGNEDIENHIDTLMHNLLADDSKSGDIIALVDDFLEDSRDVAKTILGEESTTEKVGTYEKVVNKLVTLVQADGSIIYADVDKMENISGVDDSLISKFIQENAGNADLKSSIESYISGMANTTVSAHIKSFITCGEGADADEVAATAANNAKVRAEIVDYLSDSKIEEIAEEYIKDPENADDVKSRVTSFVENIDAAFVETYRDTIEDALTDMDLSGRVDKDTVKEHIAGLTPEEKQNFADKIYNTLIKTDDVKTFIESLLNDETFDITEDNLSIIKAIAEALRGFEYEDVMAEINNETLNKVIDIVGEDFIKDQFNTIIGDYCDGLDEVIAQVEADNVTRQYTTSLTVTIDIINDIYKPLYEKAQSKVEDKIQDVYGIDFTENPYIKFLVEDDITARLFNTSAKTNELTGYQLRDVLDYYDYMYMLLLVADDAACWFGIDENVTDAELDAIYEAMIGKMLVAHGKLNDIIETYMNEDKLPAQVESILDSVKQLNDAFLGIEPTLKNLFDKYLKSSINESLENGDVPGVEKGDKLIDILVGQENPVVNVDTIYNVFYYYDDTVKDKLAEVIETDKFKEAVEKFENGELGSYFKGNGRFGTLADRLDEIAQNGKVQGVFDSVYDVLVTVSKYGTEPFRVEKDKVTTEDAYEVSVGDVTLKIMRHYD